MGKERPPPHRPPREESSLPSEQGKPSTLFSTPICVDTSIGPGVLLPYRTFSKSLKQQPRELTEVGVLSISCPQRLYFLRNKMKLKIELTYSPLLISHTG